MTKPKKQWPGELGKPITELPARFLTHGGLITDETIDAYNAHARANIARALFHQRSNKIPLLAEYYGVGAQNYKGIAVALAGEFIKDFCGNIDDLKKAYSAPDNKSLAIALATKFVPGFAYRRPHIMPQSLSEYTDPDTNKVIVVGLGGMVTKKAFGRPKQWDEDHLRQLSNDVQEIKKQMKIKTDREALEILKRKPRWRGKSLETLESRLQDAKTYQNQEPPEFIRLLISQIKRYQKKR
jgi:hypothetical protein